MPRNRAGRVFPRSWLGGGLAALLAACATGPVATRPDDAGPAGKAAAVQPGAPNLSDANVRRSELPEFVAAMQDKLTAGVLLPSEKSSDSVVVRIGDVGIHKSHVYDRLFEANARATKNMVDGMVFDIILAQQAKKHGVYIEPKQIDKIVDEEIARLVRHVEVEWKGRMSVDDFLQIQKGVDQKTHRLFMRRQMARDLFRYYVVRYLALREDRVQVRIITQRDKSVISRLREKAQEGADFESLALKHSEHGSQKDGGKLPPFTRKDRSEFTEAAFGLKEGAVSEVRQTTQDGAPMYYLLYCERHMPGRNITFEKAKPELDKAWLTSPLTRGEWMALYRRLREEIERPTNGQPIR